MQHRPLLSGVDLHDDDVAVQGPVAVVHAIDQDVVQLGVGIGDVRVLPAAGVDADGALKNLQSP